MQQCCDPKDKHMFVIFKVIEDENFTKSHKYTPIEYRRLGRGVERSSKITSFFHTVTFEYH